MMVKNIQYYLQAGYAGLFIKTVEEVRVQRMFHELVTSSPIDYDLYTFDINSGLANCLEEGGRPCNDPVEALEMASQMDGDAITLFFDFHVFLDEGGPHFALEVKRAIRQAKKNRNHLVFIGCKEKLPEELKSEVTVFEYDLPSREELEEVVDQIAQSAAEDNPEFTVPSPQERSDIAAALRGLTLEGASDALAFSLVKNKRFDIREISFEKAKQINQGGLMEVIPGEGTMDDIGGLEQAKKWVLNRRRMFDPNAKKAGAQSPKGVLNIGVPGSGKTLFSRILGNVYQLPILRVNMGALFSSLVGDTEANARMVLKTAQAMAPVILEIDEIDKGIGSTMGGASGDSGTTQRVIQTFLTWAAEDHEGVFLIATANDPKKMMDSGGALIRKGRFDEMFFFDLPQDEEREQIIRIHLNKRSRKNPDCPLSPVGSADELDIAEMVECTKGFTGAEIEAAISAAFTEAFNCDNSDIVHEIYEQIAMVNPLSESQSESMTAIRDWGLKYCRPASSLKPKVNNSRKVQFSYN